MTPLTVTISQYRFNKNKATHTILGAVRGSPTTLLLHTTCMRSCCNWRAGCVAAYIVRGSHIETDFPTCILVSFKFHEWTAHQSHSIEPTMAHGKRHCSMSRLVVGLTPCVSGLQHCALKGCGFWCSTSLAAKLCV